MANIWNGKTFKKALEYLVRILLRLHLAPRREEGYKRLLGKLADERAKQANQNSNRNIRQTQHPLHRKEQNYMEKCERRMAEAWSDEEKQKWASRRYGSQKRLNKIAEDWDRRLTANNSNCINEAVAILGAEENKQVCNDYVYFGHQILPKEINLAEAMQDAGYNEDEVIETLEDVSDDEDNSSVTEQSIVNNHSKEPSSRRIRQLKGFTKKLLMSQDELPEKDQLRTIWTGDERLTDTETEAIHTIISKLLPFIPRTKHITDMLPFVMLANSILRVTGYHQFVREVSPMVSAGSIHSVRVDATALYEMFGSRDAPFQLYDGNDNSIRNVNDARSNKEAVFGSFFDRAKIHELCGTHGLQFEHCIDVTSFNVARLHGATNKASPEGPSCSVQQAKWTLKNHENKRNKGDSGKERARITRPTLVHHACEERNDCLDLSRLEKETAESSRKFAFSGTDCGIVKMSVTVPMSLQQYRHHIELYNRFQPLSTKGGR
ncbi:hypothetical protein VTP01DRAFT_9653 [Rhizomucor pusillus]|uniref:uncharacterized protein n=1 Tax=Rhizomucor pusillus TaxID=4840 RepID=UPI0037440D8E